VIDSRLSHDDLAIRRRRECLDCKRRFTTYERVEEIDLLVVKKDGRRERFDRNKVVQGMLRACEKRPISIDTIEEFVSSLERELQEAGDLEIDSKEIGERVIRKLYDVDEVAYVRFASVYRSFKDVNQFMDELKELLKGKEGPEAAVSLHEPSGGDNDAEEEKSIRYIGPGRRRGDLADVD